MEGTTLSNTASAATAAVATATVAHITAAPTAVVAAATAETEWVSKWSAKSINAVGSRSFVRSFVRRRRSRRVKPSESDRMARFTWNTFWEGKHSNGK